VVWKYRYKKAKLWKNLEKKYGFPVLEEHEWADWKKEGDDTTDDNDEHEDLDNEGGKTSSDGSEQEL
jgi:hypothetical protein